MAESLFVKANEVAEVLGVSRAEAYRIIKRLNGELAAKGYEKCIDATINILVTVAGVTLALLLTNFDLNKQEASKTIELLGSLDREWRIKLKGY